MTNVPGYPATLSARRDGDAQQEESPDAIARLGERRSYASPYGSLTFTVLTRGPRELSVTLAAQPVFDLHRSIPVARRVRRTVRHSGGESALMGRRRSLEPADLNRIDLQTLRNGLEMLRLGPNDAGVLPCFWRTVASSDGRFARLSSEMQHAAAPGTLLVEIMGGLEQAPLEEIQEAISQFETASLGVILHIAPDAGAARRLSQVRAQCLVIDFAGVEHEHARDWLSAANLIAVARQACPQLMLLNLRPDRGLAAQAAGATHAVFAGMNAVVI